MPLSQHQGGGPVLNEADTEMPHRHRGLVAGYREFGPPDFLRDEIHC
jgi:hypothetical protein